MTVNDLIEILKQEDPQVVVEFIVCKSDGKIIALMVKEQVKPIAKVLKLFN